ncbi:hypothetical protein MBOU_18550 [Mycobacterium bourgelatii]|uniref:Uncharacterized protein n=1 Tax=Mycobacterium bourgelatii TaxID=1273442 RepID=A0A7I9YMU6_MYCBU|nr:hypothetical protein MBOU_18550 [Mycobacterium bourgelatii]
MAANPAEVAAVASAVPNFREARATCRRGAGVLAVTSGTVATATTAAALAAGCRGRVAALAAATGASLGVAGSR